MTDAEMTAAGGVISGRIVEKDDEPPVDTRVSPVRVYFSPRITPTEPNRSSSTSSASDA
jgi:hypothetical protein